MISLIVIDVWTYTEQAEFMTWPPSFLFVPALENFPVLFDVAPAGRTSYGAIKVYFMTPMTNSVVIALRSIMISLLIGGAAGYVLAKRDLPLNEDVGFFNLGFRFAPVLLVVIPFFGLSC
ncbi:hypothetical protein [Bradyrhizobium sp. SBR1B]|uniref:hypothetical protein n=1 Tax=Bradyrhizobium sp. SBR1B TaxID=2663836 RepID=UPI0018007F51|nr:hypothetical protein [Bradyrhizobium sp. SBR1B]MBB4383232.1 ABC-type glycerol-3-phosphate transport system permease component [Bradyrhizobium sp. SBR1B]